MGSSGMGALINVHYIYIYIYIYKTMSYAVHQAIFYRKATFFILSKLCTIYILDNIDKELKCIFDDIVLTLDKMSE